MNVHIRTASSVYSGSSTRIARKDLQQLVSEHPASIRTETTQQVPHSVGGVVSPLVTARGTSSDIRASFPQEKKFQEREQKPIRVSSGFTPKLHPIPQQVHIHHFCILL